MLTLIRNGLVYDGTNAEPRERDILIGGERIVRIGSLPKNAASRVIDATGCSILPGGIDLGGNFDQNFSLTEKEEQENLLRRGFTTFIGGSLGTSILPLDSEFIEYHPLPHTARTLTIGWRAILEMRRSLKNKLAYNFGTYLGLANIMHAFRHKSHGENRKTLSGPEKNYIAKMLRDGARGIAYNTADPLTRGLSVNTLFELASIAATEEKPLVVCLAAADAESAIRLLGSAGLRTHAQIVVYLSQPDAMTPEAGKHAFGALDELASRIRITCIIPLGGDIAAPLVTLLPSALAGKNPGENVRALKNKSMRENVRAHLAEIVNLDEYRIVDTPEHLFSLKNMLFSACRSHYGSDDQGEAIIRHFERTGLKGSYKPPCRQRKKTLLQLAMKKTWAVFAPEEDGAQNLASHAAALSVPLQTLIEKLTALPAERLGITDRGAIREKNFADLVFTKDNLVTRVMVNGQQAFKNDALANIRSGHLL